MAAGGDLEVARCFVVSRLGGAARGAPIRQVVEDRRPCAYRSAVTQSVTVAGDDAANRPLTATVGKLEVYEVAALESTDMGQLARERGRHG